MDYCDIERKLKNVLILRQLLELCGSDHPLFCDL